LEKYNGKRKEQNAGKMGEILEKWKQEKKAKYRPNPN